MNIAWSASIKYLIGATRLGFIALLSLGLAACDQDGQQGSISLDFQKNLQSQLLDARRGTVIQLPEGRFNLDRPLSLTVDGVTIRGAGMDKTILSFKKQITGAEGLLVTASDFTIEDLAIEDTKGDALKVNEGKNIVIRRVRTEWTGGPSTKNGAYGIYPVQTENVLIDGAVAIGASDAGIYVGQSKRVVIKNSRAEYNVAGIEVENTVDADVFDNITINNTGGILVFSMPHLPQAGARSRIFRNEISNNNTSNFALEGTAVAGVPAGSGVVVNANDDVQIFNNNFADNDTANIIISSVFSSNYSEDEQQPAFDPYPDRIYIHDNVYEGGGDSPGTLALQALRIGMFGFTGRLPNVLWDGYVSPNAAPTICVEGEPDTQVLNADGPHDYESPTLVEGSHRCKLPPLSAVVLNLQ